MPRASENAEITEYIYVVLELQKCKFHGKIKLCNHLRTLRQHVNGCQMRTEVTGELASADIASERRETWGPEALA